MKDIEQALDAFVRQVSRAGKLDAEVIRDQLPAGLLSRQRDKSFLKSLLSLSAQYRERGHLGRFRACLVVGTVILGPKFLTKVERAGLLLSDGMSGFGRFLSKFVVALYDATDEALPLLKNRLETYVAYHRLASGLRGVEAAGAALLRKRPRRVIKALLALTNLFFLREKLGFEFGDQFAEFFAEFRNPEDMATVTSLLVAAANEHHIFDALDFAFPLSEEIIDQEVVTAARYGKDAYLRHETWNLISLFGYRLEVARERGPTVFYLRPPSHEFEYFLRLGMIREELAARPFTRADTPFHTSGVSLLAMARMFADHFSEIISEVVGEETISERLRLHLPVTPEIYQRIASAQFYEDAMVLDRLAQQFLIPLRRNSTEESRLTEDLSLRDFLRIWKPVHFVALVEVSVLERYAKSRPSVIRNSLVLVSREEALKEVLRALDISERQADDFLFLVSGDVHKLGHCDLQYRPFLRIASNNETKEGKIVATPPEILHLPALVAMSNIVPNLQHSNKFGWEPNAAELFVDVIASMFRKRLPSVVINRPLKKRIENNRLRVTDADVVVFENSTLYVFECKYSVPPNDPHELRDAWEAIEGAADQLRLAVDILNDAQAR